MLSIFLCISLPKSIKTGSLTEYRACLSARLVASQTELFFCLYLTLHDNAGLDAHTHLLCEC